MKIFIPMDAKELGSYLAYKWKAKCNYYLFVEGINVCIFIIILFFMLVFFFIWSLTRNNEFANPLENIQKIYINVQFVIFAITLALLSFFSIKSKSKEKMIRNLLITSLVSLMTLMVFLGVKIHFNNIYTEKYFDNLYEINVKEKDDTVTQKIKINMKNLEIKNETQKDRYIDQLKNNYKIFSIRASINIVLHFLVSFLGIYMIIKLVRKEKLKRRLEKDDTILYDDEINVKY